MIKTTTSNDLKWRQLLDCIGMGNVIPVIGQGAYWILNDRGDKVLLYKHLAHKLAKEMKSTLSDGTNHTFSKMVFCFLQKTNDYIGLKDFLSQHLDDLAPIPNGPLIKLAQIKPFSTFINTTYDHYLEAALNTVRSYPTKVFNHTHREKKTNRISQADISDSEALKVPKCSLLLHLYGNLNKNFPPSYTENDILETIVKLIEDMAQDTSNIFLQTLESKSLLFIGCGYDDWLYRLFLRTFRDKTTGKIPIYVGDNFKVFQHCELIHFLKEHDSHIFSCGPDTDFVEELYKRMQKDRSHLIIPPEEFKETVFISFHRDDRRIARRLATQLRNDKIRVWLDEKEFGPGDEVDQTIISAIRKCDAFIPLVSTNTKKFDNDSENLNYHIREWERAFMEFTAGNNPKTIIPVIIDDTKWMYSPFRNKFNLKLPGGKRGKPYEQLLNRLLEIQDIPRLP